MSTANDPEGRAAEDRAARDLQLIEETDWAEMREAVDALALLLDPMEEHPAWKLVALVSDMARGRCPNAPPREHDPGSCARLQAGLDRLFHFAMAGGHPAHATVIASMGIAGAAGRMLDLAMTISAFTQGLRDERLGLRSDLLSRMTDQIRPGSLSPEDEEILSSFIWTPPVGDGIFDIDRAPFNIDPPGGLDDLENSVANSPQTGEDASVSETEG